MDRTNFDNRFSYFSLSEIIENSSKTKVRKLLKSFKCEKNLDLQDFLHKQAFTFEINFRSRTYIYIDNIEKNVVAYFTIAIKTLETENLSTETILLLDGHNDKVKSIPCFLIGQLGKSDLYKDSKIGKFILEDAIDKIDSSQTLLGGRFILLDSVNIPKVISFYESNSFFAIDNSPDLESIRMIRPYFTFDSEASLE